VLMAAALAEVPLPASKTARKRVISGAYKQVSEQLGNTPAVCKASYVDPRVVDRFENGETVAHVLRTADEAEADRDTQKVLEQAVCQLLSA
jgi:DNA topoisomerase IB